MAKAVAFSSFGDPDVLQVIDVAEPEPGRGQVRVRVKTAGVQPADCRLRRGDFAGIVPVTFPQRLGNEFAGIIDRVGEDVTAFAVGDAVLGFTAPAAYAELVVVGSNQIVTKPPSLDWLVAGVMSASGQTAFSALKELGVGPGDTVLVHAAAGGVGTVAVQLAREWGATVIGTATEGNHAYLRSLGAIPTTYGDGLVDRVRALAPGGVDAALDAIGGAAIPVSLELVKNRERIGSIADPRAESFGIRFLRSTRSTETLAELVKLSSLGKLRIHIHKGFPLAEAAAAHREVETGHVRGKVVLVVS